MRVVCLTRALFALAIAAALGSPLLAQSAKTQDDKARPAASEQAKPAEAPFATLRNVKAVPMTAGELKAVKGLHVHFVDAGGGARHLAGDVKHENNWENLGGSDGQPVAPSYHGLCIAAGISGPAAGAISIPGGQFQCPL